MTPTANPLARALRLPLALIAAPLRAAAWLLAAEAELDLAQDRWTLRCDAAEQAEAR